VSRSIWERLSNINTGYNFIANWNRAILWLSYVFDTDFPYYNITINSNSTNAVAIIEKYILQIMFMYNKHNQCKN